jgi:signal peptidase I
VRGGSVEAILKDNGYTPTSTPRPGDIVVYRDQDTQQVSHTGIVRTVLDEVVLIESKLGSLGRFIHPANKHPYANTSLIYYHTRRGAHVLNGLDGMRRLEVDTLVTE